MKRYRITYKKLNEEYYPLESQLITLDVYDAEVDKGFVCIWFDDDYHDDYHGADLILNANLVYKIERIKEKNNED